MVGRATSPQSRADNSQGGSARSVLVVNHHPFFGGPQNQVLRLMEPLRERGWKTVALLPDEPGNAAARLRANGIEVVEIQLHRLRASTDPRLLRQLVTGFAREVRDLRALIRRLKIDVVQVNGLINPHAAIAARLESVPVVWQILDTRPPMALRRLIMPLVKMLSDVIMTTGMTVARAHPGALSFGPRLVPFFPPVDTSLFRPDPEQRCRARKLLSIPESAPLIGTVANVTPMKGLEFFLTAAHLLLQSVPDAHFAILGAPMESQPQYDGKIRRMAADLGLIQSGRLTIRDPGDAVSLYLGAFDIFVLTSVPLSEGISTTVLEAMSTGIPVVTTRVGGLTDAVQDGVTGSVVPPRDAAAVARASQLILQDGALRNRMSEQARQVAVERFDVQLCAAVHANAYEAAVQHHLRRVRGTG